MKGLIRIAGICGILAPVIAISSVFLSIFFEKNFSWTGNALSDLGVSEGISSPIFNFGLMISGILFFVYGIGLFNFFEGIIPKLGTLILLMTSIALSSIGVFTENAEPFHYYASATFFLLFPISTFIFAIYFYLTRRLKLALLSFFTFVVVVIAVAWIVAMKVGIAIPETLASVSMFVLPLVLGYELATSKSIQ